MDTATAITLVIAAWGAGLSTFLAIRELRKDKPRVTVRARIGFIPLGIGFTVSAEDAPKMLSVTAVNVGHRPVELTGIAFFTDDGQKWAALPLNMPVGERLPKMLTDGESVTLFFEADEMQATFGDRELARVVLSDNRDNDYTAEFTGSMG